MRTGAHPYPVFKRLALFLLLLLPVAAVATQPVIEHQITARIDPGAGRISAEDRLALPRAGSWDLWLHKETTPRVIDGDAELTLVRGEQHLELYRLDVRSAGPVTLSYSGAIRHRLDEVKEGAGRARHITRGVISKRGVFLDGFSGWYPRIDGTLQRFELSVELPSGWSAISQGAGPNIAEIEGGVAFGWREDAPQDDIYLVAAPFERYSRSFTGRKGPIQAQAWLRSADETLAKRYLDATVEYIQRYERLLGPYPYAKFALVENFWETGYGMPSFTLLGPKVLRLPFILHTSYPHEILHNWWGNGVFVDYESGNWSEGLTAYLADYLNKEQKGEGLDYRRDTLKSYQDYVASSGRDFPLSRFKSRHGVASQSVGYGKALMVFHMLRRQLGDRLFVDGLRRFYADNLFKSAGWRQLREALDAVSGEDLKAFFTAWTAQAGAPRLNLRDVTLHHWPGGFQISARVDQIQAEPAFPMPLDLLVHQRDGSVVERQVEFRGRSADIEIDVPILPVRMAVDPGLDSFRRLEDSEAPPTLSNLFGAKSGLIILPGDADPDLFAAYKKLARAWTRGNRRWKVRPDSRVHSLPRNESVWVLGWNNRWAGEAVVDLYQLEVDLAARTFAAEGQNMSGRDNSVAIASRVDGRTVGWIAGSSPEAVATLARKLPHYGKYGYVAFHGDAADMRLKGKWKPGDSALVHWFEKPRGLTLQQPVRRPLLDLLREPVRLH